MNIKVNVNDRIELITQKGELWAANMLAYIVGYMEEEPKFIKAFENALKNGVFLEEYYDKFSESPLEDIRIDDYIEGYEYSFNSDKGVKIKGWIDSIKKRDQNTFVFDIQADDRYGGVRGTTVFSDLGIVTKLELKERPKSN